MTEKRLNFTMFHSMWLCNVYCAWCVAWKLFAWGTTVPFCCSTIILDTARGRDPRPLPDGCSETSPAFDPKWGWICHKWVIRLHFIAKKGWGKITRKTYFYQNIGPDIFKLSIDHTENNRTDLPVSTVPLPSPYLPSRRGLWPKYIWHIFVKKLNIFGTSLNPTPFPF